MKKYMTVILCLFFLCIPPLTAKGEETVWFLWECQEEAVPGEKVSLLLSLEGTCPQNISTFRARVTFDPSVLEFRGLQAEGETEEEEYSYHEKEGTVVLIFLSDHAGVSANGDKKELCSFNFLMKESVEDGTIPVAVELDGVGTDQLQELQFPNPQEAEISIVTPDYSLQALQPDTGALQPEFRPDILQYTLEVPYSLDRISFFAKAIREDASVKVSRKTLEKAGETTTIKITVRSPDGIVQKTYEVAVYRQERPEGAIGSSGKNSATDKKGNTSSSRAVSDQKGKTTKDSSHEETGSDGNQERTSSQEDDQTRTHMIPKEDRSGDFWMIMGVCAAAGLLILGIPYLMRTRKKRKRFRKEK